MMLSPKVTTVNAIVWHCSSIVCDTELRYDHIAGDLQSAFELQSLEASTDNYLAVSFGIG